MGGQRRTATGSDGQGRRWTATESDRQRWVTTGAERHQLACRCCGVRSCPIGLDDDSSSSFAHEKKHIMTSPFRYVVNELCLYTSKLKTLGWVEHETKGEPVKILGGGFASLLFEITKAKSVPCLVLYKFASEGDNIPDAYEMVQHSNHGYEMDIPKPEKGWILSMAWYIYDIAECSVHYTNWPRLGFSNNQKDITIEPATRYACCLCANQTECYADIEPPND
ncbi:hypothetical protein HW555_006284 [Spodoptera exigua]|uniref:Uncharacterized protein n=1 Tax=Spodoptera exigua TaxID=7107 RepID=A0A835L6L3_SPOEX|nr:hypothetical protein HW555_006284 [Spodoptera exigua]